MSITSQRLELAKKNGFLVRRCWETRLSRQYFAWCKKTGTPHFEVIQVYHQAIIIVNLALFRYLTSNETAQFREFVEELIDKENEHIEFFKSRVKGWKSLDSKPWFLVNPGEIIIAGLFELSGTEMAKKLSAFISAFINEQE
jgi:hypothetical protein